VVIIRDDEGIYIYSFRDTSVCEREGQAANDRLACEYSSMFCNIYSSSEHNDISSSLYT
jgi:hypothetical protein